MSLFSGTPVESTETATTATPDWYQNMLYNQLNWANALAQRPYESYPGEKVAPLSAQEQQAYRDVSANQGMWRSPLQTAVAGYGDIARSAAPSVQNINAYMNPYMSGVVNQIAMQGARNLRENLLPQVSDAFVRAGQFGGSRMGEFGSRALRDTQEAILAQQADAMRSGYSEALQAAGADVDRRRSALEGMMLGAETGQRLSSSDVAALEAAGSAQRAAQQRDIDADVAEFQAQQGWPMSLSDWYMSQLTGSTAGLPKTTTGTGVTNTGPSPLAQIATAAAVTGGLWEKLKKWGGG